MSDTPRTDAWEFQAELMSDDDRQYIPEAKPGEWYAMVVAATRVRALERENAALNEQLNESHLAYSRMMVLQHELRKQETDALRARVAALEAKLAPWDVPCTGRPGGAHAWRGDQAGCEGCGCPRPPVWHSRL